MLFYIALYHTPYNIEINKSFVLNSIFLREVVLFDLDLLDCEIVEFSLSEKKKINNMM